MRQNELFNSTFRMIFSLSSLPGMVFVYEVTEWRAAVLYFQNRWFWCKEKIELQSTIHKTSKNRPQFSTVYLSYFILFYYDFFYESTVLWSAVLYFLKIILFQRRWDISQLWMLHHISLTTIDCTFCDHLHCPTGSI